MRAAPAGWFVVGALVGVLLPWLGLVSFVPGVIVFYGLIRRERTTTCVVCPSAAFAIGWGVGAAAASGRGVVTAGSAAETTFASMTALGLLAVLVGCARIALRARHRATVLPADHPGASRPSTRIPR